MKIQSPKGTRDFYPDEMAWRRYLEKAWRSASIRNGFEEIEGPIFELLDLYKVKSGDGIISELFHFTDRGERELAIRPEFTPTLARMAAAKANALPRPIKWFSMPNLCRAERPQRGRLREFLQWNVDMLGLDDPVADAETIFCAVDCLKSLGLQSNQVKVKVSHRDVVRRILGHLGVPDEKMLDAFNLLDRRDKLPAEVFREQAADIGLDEPAVERFNQVAQVRLSATSAWDELVQMFTIPEQDLEDLHTLNEQLKAFGILEWCEYDLGIVRGLAYYTGTVFEIHEASGAERAMAGGGRYDNLIEMFDGPSMPAVGFGMGDVVLSLVLQDKDLLPEHVTLPVDVFVFSTDAALRSEVVKTVSQLRNAELHTRYSYKTTTKVGKLLKDAENVRARHCVIIDAKLPEQGIVNLKNMDTGEQEEIPAAELLTHLA